MATSVDGLFPDLSSFEVLMVLQRRNVDVGSAGPWSSFDELYARYFSMVVDSAVRVVGVSAVAEEIAQEVLLGVWRRQDFDPTRASLATYLKVLGHHRAVDSLRSTTAQARRDLRLVRDERKDVVTSDEPALASIEQTLVWEALAKLPQRQRQPIVLAFFGGMSYRHVAAHLDLPEGTIKSRIRKGMKTLAELLERPS
ncbi:MAG: sigma-70 family RNA polymerase sigma factor [Acidimicrobiales bacterium]